MFRYIAFPIILLIICSCNNTSNNTPNHSTAPPPKEIPFTAGMLSSKTDYVCGMELRDGGIADTAHYDGKIYGFCHSDCKKEFLKAPLQYLSAAK
ncbi:MAG: YHS domain-containing protein [Chitinophagales bacterium]|nr:YHS domain-containing protein [Chitinophagales bacterium]MDW8419611.1 YHS domain-containing protein [Chitinophagales bacterium]